MKPDAKKDLFLALDQGTTSSRAIVFSLEGKVIGRGQVELPVQFPQEAWVEQKAEDIWSTQEAALQQAVAGVDLERIAAIGITNQRETTLVWDRETGKPLAPAIVWQCRRSESVCREVRTEKNAALVRGRSGLVIDPYFSASKIRWLREHNEEVDRAIRENTAACGTVDTWLMYQLSKKQQFLTEPSNASRTMLMNIDSLAWDEELLSLWDLPRAVLPDIQASASSFLTTTILGPDIPVCGVLGDQQAALLGHGCVNQGEVKCTFGTGAFLLLNTGDSLARSESGLLSTVAWSVPDEKPQYALEGSIFIAGAAVQWLRDKLELITDAGETEGLAETVASAEGVVVVPSFTGLGAPYWEADARGAIFGITRDTSKAHIVRATLDGVVHQLADLMQDPEFANTKQLRIDGGMSLNSYFSQAIADLTRCSVVCPEFSERTALGAARIAAVGSGFCATVDEAVQRVAVDAKSDTRFEVVLEKKRWERRRADWKQAVTRLRTPTEA